MAITINCPACTSLFNLPENLAGQQVRCAACQQLFVVPMPANFASERASAPPEPEPSPPAAPVEAAEAAKPIEPRTPKSQRPPPSRTAANHGWTIALLFLFVIAMLSVGGFAVVWTLAHLGPSIPMASTLPTLVPKDMRLDGADRDLEKRDDRVRHEKDPPMRDFVRDLMPFLEDKVVDPFDRKVDRKPVVPTRINGFDGRVSIDGRTDFPAGVDHGRWGNHGPYRLYTMNLEQGKTYNFHVSGFEITPRLQIYDGDKIVAERVGPLGVRRVMVSYQPKRTGDHLFLVSSFERFVGGFFLNIMPEARSAPTAVDVTQKPSYTDANQLRIEHPLAPGQSTNGPYREYEVKVEAGEQYAVSVVAPINFMPILQVTEKDKVVERTGIAIGFNPQPETRISLEYRAIESGKIRIRVTSKDYGLGNFTFSIARKVANPQTILAALDARGAYEDSREFTDADPRLKGRGEFKAYLIALEEGKKYRIEMSIKDGRGALVVLDPAETKLGETDGIVNASLVFQPRQSGVHRIHAASVFPRGRQAYDLKITTVP